MLLMISLVGHAQEPVPVSEERHYRFATKSYIFDEPGLTWEKVANRPLSSGISNQSIVLNLTEYKFPTWIRVDLAVKEIPTQQWLYDIGHNFGGRIDFYAVQDGKLIAEHSMNSFESYNTRPYDHRRVKFPLSLAPNTNVSLLLKVTAAHEAVYHTHLFSERSFVRQDRQSTWLLGMHMGLLMALMAYHFLLAGATRDKNYLYYSIYIASCAVFSLSRTGFGFQYLWPDLPIVETTFGPPIQVLPSVFAAIFAVNFLQLNNHVKWLGKTYYAAVAVIFGLAMVRGFEIYTGVEIATYLSVIIYLSLIPTSLYILRKGVVYARFFLIAWTLYIFALVNWILSGVGIYLFLPQYAYEIQQIAFDLQIILLGLALAHRIRVLRNEKVEAEADNRAKSAFLARMSHEIRTPLSGVLGMSDLLADRLKDKSDIYYNNIVRSSGSSLLTIINDILDYSKFTSGNMELEHIPFNIRRLAADSLDLFKIKAAEKNIELIADINSDLPTYVEGDPTRVKQVILNFISNAIKFTDKGQIVLSIDYAGEDNDMLRIGVTDTGEGVSKSQQKHLFEAFSQANSATTRKHGGTGLGLSICKELATLMGGKVGIDSEHGKGSTFWFTARLPASASLEPIESNDVELSGCRILIVEDNYTFAELLKAQAQTWGMEPIVARNGREGLNQIKRIYDQGLTVDLISLDLFMPLMDGMEFSRQLQQDERFQDIPRVLLTSATNFPPKQQLENAGIDKVIEKPTLPADLAQIYKQLLAGEAQHSNTEPASGTDRKTEIPPINILVVEDNEVNQKVIEGVLRRLNQTPTLVDDGEEAVRLITKENQYYDLVLMDCEMPRMDGITATATIRAWERDNNQDEMPIVALTAHAVTSQMEACDRAGMNAYLTKPIEIDKLEDLLRSYAEHQDLESYAIGPVVSGS